jgi:hypothetical protein
MFRRGSDKFPAAPRRSDIGQRFTIGRAERETTATMSMDDKDTADCSSTK